MLSGQMASFAFRWASAFLPVCTTISMAYPATAVFESSTVVPPAFPSMPLGSPSVPNTGHYPGAVPARADGYRGRDFLPLYAADLNAAGGTQSANFRGDVALSSAFPNRHDTVRGYRDQNYGASTGYLPSPSTADFDFGDTSLRPTCVQCREHGAEASVKVLQNGAVQEAKSSPPGPQHHVASTLPESGRVPSDSASDQSGRHITAPANPSTTSDHPHGPPQRQSWLFSATRDKLSSAIGFMKNTQEHSRYPIPARGVGLVPESGATGPSAGVANAQIHTSQPYFAGRTVEALPFHTKELPSVETSSTSTGSVFPGEGAHPQYNVYVSDVGAPLPESSFSTASAVPFTTQHPDAMLSSGFLGPQSLRQANLALGFAANAYQHMIPRAELFLASSRYAEEYLDLFAALYCLFQKLPCNNMEEFAEETRRRQEGSGR